MYYQEGLEKLTNARNYLEQEVSEKTFGNANDIGVLYEVLNFAKAAAISCNSKKGGTKLKPDDMIDFWSDKWNEMLVQELEK